MADCPLEAEPGEGQVECLVDLRGQPILKTPDYPGQAFLRSNQMPRSQLVPLPVQERAEFRIEGVARPPGKLLGGPAQVSRPLLHDGPKTRRQSLDQLGGMLQASLQGVSLHLPLEFQGQDPDLVLHRREALPLLSELPLELRLRLRHRTRCRTGHLQVLPASASQRPKLVPDDLWLSIPIPS